MCMYSIQVSDSRYWHSLYDQEHKKVMICDSSLSALRVQMKQKDEQIDELEGRLKGSETTVECLERNREAQIAHINDLQNVISRRNGEIGALKTALERVNTTEKHGPERLSVIDVQFPAGVQFPVIDWYALFIECDKNRQRAEAERDELKKRVEELERQPIFVRDALYYLSEVEHRIDLAKKSLEQK